jgi:hypothetical protein
VAAAYALLIAAGLYRSLRWPDLYDALLSSARMSISIGMLIAGALVFNYVITSENIPATLRGTRPNHSTDSPARPPAPAACQRQQGRQFGVALAGLQARAEVLVHAVQRLGGAGVVVLATGHLRHLAQRGLVELQVHRHAVAHGGMAVGRAQAHHVDAHAAVGGHARRLQRVDAGGAAAVAQQDDRGRRRRSPAPPA